MKKDDLLKVSKYSLILLNIVGFVFGITYSIFRTGTALADVFAVILIVTFILNLIYATFNNKKTGWIIILLTGVLYFLNLAFNLITGLSVFHLTVSVVACISICLIPAIAVGVIIYDTVKGIDNKKTVTDKFSLLKIILITVLFLFLIVLVLLGYDTLLGSGVSQINTNTVNFAMAFIILGTCCLSIIVKLLRPHKDKTFKIFVYTVSGLLCLFTIFQFALVEGSGYADTKNNEQIFKMAFGENSLNYQCGRKSAYVFADELFGIKTTGYKIDRDIVYYQSEDNGLTLRYDVYYPTFENAKRAVLVNIHGSGGDKDIGNYAHRNKYFASQGYVVYDIQIGDYNERNTGIQNLQMVESRSNFLLSNIDKFFVHLNDNNAYNADLNNTFIAGVSMGGTLACKYALSFDNSLSSLDIELRGIIPIYPGYSSADKGIDNFTDYVDKNSIPCLIVMGTRDGIVDPNAAYYIYKAYENAGNMLNSVVYVSYAGHGSDSLCSGRMNQQIMYFAERFMAVCAV